MVLEKTNILVSIIINNYNYGRFLGTAIDSALKQSYPYTEVIVVDDGSTDNSQEVITGYGNRLIPILKQNGGQASAFNAGFAASRGEIICLLDSDDVFLPEKVAEIVNVFTDQPETGWCFHSLRLIEADTKTLSKGRHEAGPSRQCDFRLVVKETGELPLHTPATSALCFKRSLLQQLLPMPEAQGISIGDHYLKFAAASLSKGFYLDQELTLQQMHGDNAYTYSENKRRFQARIYVLTAYWIRVKFPTLAKLANKVFTTGLSIYWQTGGTELEYQKLVNDYLASVSLRERLEINLRVFYSYTKRVLSRKPKNATIGSNEGV